MAEKFDMDTMARVLDRLDIGKIERRVNIPLNIAPSVIAILYVLAREFEGDIGPVVDRALIVYAALSPDEREARFEAARHELYSFVGTLDIHAEEIERLRKQDMTE